MLLFPALSGFSQKYRTAADTIRLNKEYLAVSNDMIDLNLKLLTAQSELPGFQSKAEAANVDASNAASASSDQASKATSGNVRDAKKAKRKAGKAYNEAKDSKAADNRVKAQKNKIDQYQAKLQKKQQRLEALDAMRAAIYAKLTVTSPF